MRFVHAVLAALTFATASPMCLVAQQTSRHPRTLADTLEALEVRSWAAWKARDSTYFRTFLSDDHVELGVSGRSNKARVVESVGSPRCVVTSYSVDNLQVTRFDANTAVVTYHATQATTCNGKPVPSPAWVSSLYVRRGGRWVNALYQQTPVPS